MPPYADGKEAQDVWANRLAAARNDADAALAAYSAAQSSPIVGVGHAVIGAIRARFKSGNSVQVERAHITLAEFSELESAISQSAPAVREDGWKPIETVPRDGTVVDLWHPHLGRMCNEFFNDNDEFDNNTDCWNSGATHWMHRPEPPK